jgi:hypothetical protein
VDDRKVREMLDHGPLLDQFGGSILVGEWDAS